MRNNIWAFVAPLLVLGKATSRINEATRSGEPFQIIAEGEETGGSFRELGLLQPLATNSSFHPLAENRERGDRKRDVQWQDSNAMEMFYYEPSDGSGDEVIVLQTELVDLVKELVVPLEVTYGDTLFVGSTTVEHVKPSVVHTYATLDADGHMQLSPTARGAVEAPRIDASKHGVQAGYYAEAVTIPQGYFTYDDVVYMYEEHLVTVLLMEEPMYTTKVEPSVETGVSAGVNIRVTNFQTILGDGSSRATSKPGAGGKATDENAHSAGKGNADGGSNDDGDGNGDNAKDEEANTQDQNGEDPGINETDSGDPGKQNGNGENAKDENANTQDSDGENPDKNETDADSVPDPGKDGSELLSQLKELTWPFQDQPVFQKAILEYHNFLRARHNSPPLTYNTELSAKARTNTDKKIWGHLPQSENPYGENIASHSAANNPLFMVYMWYSEIKDFNDYNKPLQDYKGPVVGHFAQVVWKAIKEVGCAFSNEKTVSENWDGTSTIYPYYLVCEYKPFFWEAGTSVDNVKPPKEGSPDPQEPQMEL